VARIGVVGVQHETNTFVPGSTEYRDFAECAFTGGIKRGESLRELAAAAVPIAGFLGRAEELGHELVPLYYAYAEPSGLLTASCFDRIAGEILQSLRSAGPLHAVYVDLHGAMASASAGEADRELLLRIRKEVGSGPPIVCTLDLHGNLADHSLEGADLAVAYRTYPHVDMADTGARAAELLHRLLAGERPHRAFAKLPFLIPLDRQSTFEEPLRTIFGKADEIEKQQGLWSLSIMLGFIQCDFPHVGPALLAYADSPAQADRAVAELAGLLLAEEHRFRSALVSPEEAAARAAGWTGTSPIVLADVEDNAGGGASSDTTGLIRALLDRGVTDAAVGMIHDEEAVSAAFALGEGAEGRLAVGGKGTAGDRPLAGSFVVRRLNSDPVVMTGPMGAGQAVDLGRTALLALDGIDIVVTSKRTQCLDRSFFTHLGVDPAGQRVLVVKSSNHFRADFEPIAGEVLLVSGEGMCTADPARIPYTRLRHGVRLYGGGPAFAGPPAGHSEVPGTGRFTSVTQA
jgi:microcystin degradation protein MlrC